MKLKTLLIFLTLISCNQKKVKSELTFKIDYEFKSNFQNCIEIMALRELGHSIRFEYTGRAYQCLKILTCHKGLIDTNSDTPLFYPYSETQNYFVEDFIAWSKWYENNKYVINMEIADSLFSLEADSLTWPPFLTEVILKDSSYVGY